MHVKPPSGAQIHLPALSAPRAAVFGTAIRPKAPDLNFRLLNEIVTLPSSAGRCRGQANSPESLHSPMPCSFQQMRTHVRISLLPNHAPASGHLVYPPAGRMEHLMGERSSLTRIAQTQADSPPSGLCDSHYRMRQTHYVLLFYGTLSCTAVKRGMGRKKKSGNKAGEGVREAERTTGSNTGPSALLD